MVQRTFAGSSTTFRLLPFTLSMRSSATDDVDTCVPQCEQCTQSLCSNLDMPEARTRQCFTQRQTYSFQPNIACHTQRDTYLLARLSHFSLLLIFSFYRSRKDFCILKLPSGAAYLKLVLPNVRECSSSVLQGKKFRFSSQRIINTKRIE